MLKEIRQFALRGNVVDMAVGIIIGGAFGTIVRSLVDDVLMPPLGLLLGNVNFQDYFLVLRAGGQPPPYVTLEAAQEAGAVTMNLGLFFNSVISFVLVAVAVYFLVRMMNRLQRQQDQAEAEPTSKGCPFCFQDIPLQARRCPHCTSELPVAA